MHGLLSQPTVDTLDEYETFAADHNLGFELVDFAYPNVLDGDARAVVDRYKSLPDPRRLVSAHGPFLDLYLNSPDPAVRAVAVERIKKTLALADELELQHHPVAAPGAPPAVGEAQKSPSEQPPQMPVV
ncbi:MAG: hypothetical protein DLM64_15600 [Solirubrobacterales bacterium]|nr:MAG: hypothetical protein DLM64_15600 [Solirubrobacterales bacterium]